MKKLAELTSPTSCLSRAAADEPLFVLRANDPAAALVVRFWAAEYRIRKKASGTFDERARGKWLEALQLADQMDVWRAEQHGH